MLRKIKNWFWFKIVISSDEFHPSLDLSISKMLGMNRKEREKYILNLVKRRNFAHEMDIKD